MHATRPGTHHARLHPPSCTRPLSNHHYPPPTPPPTPTQHPPDLIQHQVDVGVCQLQPPVLLYHLLDVQDLLHTTHTHTGMQAG